MKAKPNRGASLPANFIEVAERHQECSPVEAMFVWLPHKSYSLEVHIENRGLAGADTPTMDRRDGDNGMILPGQAPPSPCVVVADPIQSPHNWTQHAAINGAAQNTYPSQ